MPISVDPNVTAETTFTVGKVEVLKSVIHLPSSRRSRGSMVKKHRLYDVLVLSWLVWAMSPIFAMAGDNLVARDALVSGSGALASGGLLP